MGYKRGRYSWLLRPTLMMYDLLVIIILALCLLNSNNENLIFPPLPFFNNRNILFLSYSITSWLFSTQLLKFYNVYRYTSVLNISSLLVKQFVIYGILVFAFEGVFRSINISTERTLRCLLYALGAISFIKLLSFYVLRAFRVYLKGNVRNVVVIGGGNAVCELKRILKEEKELGYNLLAVFNNSEGKYRTGNTEDSFNFIRDNQSIDEIYCAIDELSEKEINHYVKLANINHCNIKFIPSTERVFAKRFQTDYYSYLPVLSIQEVGLNSGLNKVMKRGFDIGFSLFVMVFILSWLSIVLFVLIKIESRGPLFYRHKRTGINYKEFNCYKFRSLTTTKEVKGTYVKPDDLRLTKIGKFLRKTNIDELPQFINVLKGDMSVVGPRPHMLSYTEDYSKKIDKYNFIFRHHVKPGVTGLAQVKGYRGEIEEDNDIINRVKYDIFYIENWSVLLDLKIMLQTFLNALKGEEKAY